MRAFGKALLCLSLIIIMGTSSVKAFDYAIKDAGTISIIDVNTGIVDLATMFTDEKVNVTIGGIEWIAIPEANITSTDTTLFYTTSVNGIIQDSGNFSLEDVNRDLPSSLFVGQVSSSKGTASISVTLTLDEADTETQRDYQVYNAGVSIIPLFVILMLAMTTRMVEFSLLTGIFVGACIVNGNIIDGFKRTLDYYILGALSNPDNVYVILFTLFLAGLVGMMQKSGGMFGFTNDISRIAKSPRTGQIACFLVGLFIFFDDYANVLLAGQTMLPLMDSLCVSREKLSFIVDATSAPIASISPVSSWVGFEVGLIQEQIDKIIAMEGTDDIGIKTSGFGVFLQSIKYRYYPIFMIVLMMYLIGFQKDWGPMLIAERKTLVYKQTDGGDGKGRMSETTKDQNMPYDDTPRKSYNLILPVLLLIFFIFYLLVATGTIEGEDQTFMDKIEASDSYSALLWGTMATALCTMLFYLLQIVSDGRLVWPTCGILKGLFFGWDWRELEDDEETRSLPRFLMNVYDTFEAFLFGMGRLFPAIIVLTLAWASGSIMEDVGADRLFANWIVSGVDPKLLPTLSFVVALFMALATGTSWGTMTILFPLILIPTYIASDGDDLIFYATTAGVLSGAVAGDHMSPISDTTVLSSLACDCNLVAHVGTQAPYAILISFLSIISGTVPIGYEAWPNIVGYLIGWFLLLMFTLFWCQKAINKNGYFGLEIELVMKCMKGPRGEALENLRADTIKAFNGEEVSREEKEELVGKDGDESSEEEEGHEQEATPPPEEYIEKEDDDKEISTDIDTMEIETETPLENSAATNNSIHSA